jgi:carboxylate-amine ligase
VEHRFHGPRYTVGVEEELMIVEPSSLDLANAIELMLGGEPPAGEIKPELLESVLEIATAPCPSVAIAAEQLIALRALARARAQRHGLQIAAAGTHPFAHWEEQRVVSADRYRGLVQLLGFVARQELVFGMHVHVGMEDPREAVHIANELRPYVPLLIAISANSPLWRGQLSGLMSSRVPIFRTVPRVGLPPRWADWEDFVRRVERMVRSGMIEDYTYLWYDIRPHPRLGTVEIRAMDSQTRVEHTVAITALVVSLVKDLAESRRAGVEARDPPPEILDENRWRAARQGLDAQLLDDESDELRPVRDMTEELLARLAPHARELGCEEHLDGVRDLLRAGNGALRQQLVYEANRDLKELMSEIVAATAEVPAS